VESAKVNGILGEVARQGVKVNEADYLKGQKAAYASIIRECARNLSGEDLSAELMAVERAEVIIALRLMCEGFKIPNDWPDDMHLGDVILKYIRPRVQEMFVLSIM
jgi:hypothetical protein